jgi:hypothetical protein
VLHDLARHAAQQRSGDRASATRADEDQVGLASSRELDDAVGGVALEHLDLCLDAGVPGLRLGDCGNLLRVPKLGGQGRW